MKAPFMKSSVTTQKILKKKWESRPENEWAAEANIYQSYMSQLKIRL